MPDDLEIKHADWEVKALDDAGEFRIYMASFGNVDRGNDVIEPGAFRNLDDYVRTGWVGVNHDMDALPVAYPIEATQDGRGLMIRGKFHSTPEGQACRTVIKERMAAGKAVTGSIGYKIDPQGSCPDYIDGKSVRRIKSLSIYESSFVNLPMNPRAEAISAKSLEGQDVDEKVMTLDDLKAWWDSIQAKGGRSISKGNHAVLKGWHGGLSTMCNEMKTFIDQYDPDRDEDQDRETEKTDLGAPTPKVGDKEATPQRRAAGNSIPADQNPHGAVIAEDIPGKSLVEWQRQREQQLNALRARVLQDQLRFARS